MKRNHSIFQILFVGLILFTSCDGDNNPRNNKVTTPTETSDMEINSDPQVAEEDNSEKWDDMLDDYEEYVDQYLVLYKEAMNGDMNALAEYPALLQKASELSKSMEAAEGDESLTPEQMERLMEIQTKMMKAAM